jgi:hypothetical protein
MAHTKVLDTFATDTVFALGEACGALSRVIDLMQRDILTQRR